MVKFTRMEMSISIEPLLNLDKITANKPSRIIISFNNNSRFKNASCIALIKQRKKRTSIITEAHLYRHNIMTNESFDTSRETSHKYCRAPTHYISFLLPCLSFFAIQGFNFQNQAVVILVIIASTAKIMRLQQNHRFWKRVIELFKVAKKSVKHKPEEVNKPKKTSVASNRKLWSLTSEDLVVTLDAYKMDYFVYNICMILVWWILSRLVSFVRRFFTKNNRK